MTLTAPRTSETAAGSVAGRSPPQTRAWAREEQGLNGLAFWLAVVVVLTPLPLASYRPIVWIGFAIVVGLTALYYGMRRTLVVKPDIVTATALVLVVLMLVVQVLPLGRLFPVPQVGMPVETISLVPGATWLTLLQVLGYGLFVYLVMQVAGPQRRTLILLLAVFLAVTAYAVLGIVQLTLLNDSILWMTKWSSRGVVSGPFVNRNSFATLLSFGLAVGMSLAIAQLGRHHKEQWPFSRLWLPLVLIGSAVIATALVMTQSRMGIVAGLAGFVMVSLVGLARTVGVGWALLVLGITGAAGLAIVWFFLPDLIDRVVSAEGPTDLRLELYAQVWRMIWERPWLGFGGGAFELAFPLFHEPSLSTRATWNLAHSTYLTLWSELGVIAGSLPMLLILIFAAKSWTALRAGGATFATGLAAVGVTVVGAVHSIADFSLEIPANVYMFWFVLTLGAFEQHTP